jgi:hypothetical protein
VKRSRKNQHRKQWRSQHPTDHRRSNALHDLGPSAMPQQDRQQTGKNHSHRHRLRPHTLHGTLADSLIQLGLPSIGMRR